MEAILSLQNPHWQNRLYPDLLDRTNFLHLLKTLQLKEIQIVLGVRRSGKSTLFRLLINHLMQQMDPKTLVYANLDDPFYANLWQDTKQFYQILETAEKITGVKPAYLFLDEIQHVQHWERFVKSIYDSELLKKIFITGSNSSLLKNNYAKLLSGRYTIEYVYPLSFKEILSANQLTDKVALLNNKPKVLNIIDDMLTHGSFPEVYKTSEPSLKRELLLNYYETILLKDCMVNHKIREAKTLQQLASYLLTNNGTLFSYNGLAKTINSNENTVKSYVNIIEESFLIDETSQFSFSLKVQIKNQKKNYCVDNGLIYIAATHFSQNKGKFFENLVYTELKKLGAKIYFFNNSCECDFIVQQEQSLIAIQACYNLTPQNREREIKGLKIALKNFSITKGYIITMNQEEIVDENIAIIPFWKYFF